MIGPSPNGLPFELLIIDGMSGLSAKAMQSALKQFKNATEGRDFGIDEAIDFARGRRSVALEDLQESWRTGNYMDITAHEFSRAHYVFLVLDAHGR